MKIDSAHELILSRRTELTTAVVRPIGSRPEKAVMPEEKSPQSPSVVQDFDHVFSLVPPESFQLEVMDDSYFYRTGQDPDNFASLTRTVDRLEGRYIPKGLYIDIFA